MSVILEMPDGQLKRLNLLRSVSQTVGRLTREVRALER